MSLETEQIVRAIYDAWRKQDLDGVARHLADGFCHDIRVPQTVHPLGGPSYGKRDSLARLARIIEQFDFLAYVIDDPIVGERRAALQAHIHYRHKVSGEELKTTLAHFWTVEAGEVIRLDEFHDMKRILDFAAKVIGPV